MPTAPRYPKRSTSPPECGRGAPNSDASYALVVMGDVDGDGNVTALDAVNILKAVIGEVTLDSYEKKVAADINGDGWVRADDAVELLKYVIGID